MQHKYIIVVVSDKEVNQRVKFCKIEGMFDSHMMPQFGFRKSPQEWLWYLDIVSKPFRKLYFDKQQYYKLCVIVHRSATTVLAKTK